MDFLGLAAGNNYYSYVSQSPVRLGDPFGLCEEQISGQLLRSDWCVRGIDIWSMAKQYWEGRPRKDADHEFKETRVDITVTGDVHLDVVIRCEAVKRCPCERSERRIWTLYFNPSVVGVTVTVDVPWLPSLPLTRAQRAYNKVRGAALGKAILAFRRAANDALENLIGLGEDHICKMNQKDSSPIALGGNCGYRLW